MVMQCQKCGKAYEPKRRGGKFCSTSCRVVQHQLVKRGRLYMNPNTGDEVYLANKLATVERTAQQTLVAVQEMPAEQALAELRKLVQGWAGVAQNSVIERILRHDRKERETNYEAYRARTGLY